MFFILFAHRWITKPFAVFYLITSTAATYFIHKYDIVIDTSMVLNTLHTDVTEVSGLLSMQMIPYIVFMIVLPALLLSRIKITFNRKGKYLITTVASITVAFGISAAMLYMEYNSIHRAANI